MHLTAGWDFDGQGADRLTLLVSGAVVLVTGAGSGIGRATAELFAAEGAAVVVVADIDEASAQETAARIASDRTSSISAGLDVADADAVSRLVNEILDHHGSLDCAVNNAAVRGSTTRVADLDVNEWRRVMAVNLDGVFYCMQAEIRAMAASGGGAIVNIASGAVVDPHAGLSAYGASKAAVAHLTQTAAVEYAADGIRVNAVLPGRTRTAMLENYYELTPGAEDKALAEAPLGRLGSPDETAQAIVWLCSDRASYVDGATLLVDGAYHAGRR